MRVIESHMSWKRNERDRSTYEGGKGIREMEPHMSGKRSEGNRIKY